MQRVKITLFGFNLNVDLDETGLMQKIILFSAGPLINISVFYALRSTEYNNFAEINKFLSLVNMIPIVPLDGGNICKSVLESFVNYSSVCRYMIMTNCFFIICFFVLIYLYRYWLFMLLILMALRGIIDEKRHLLERSIKYNYYKKIKRKNKAH